MKKTAPKPSRKIITARKLARASFADLRSGWKRYWLIIAIVSVPVDVLGLVTNANTSATTIDVYSSFASIIMNVALIWAIIQKGRTGVAPRMAQAYYQGSVGIVRFILIAVLLVLMLIPAALGAVIYRASTVAGIGSSAPTSAEELAIGVVCALLVIPSLHLLIRFGLGLIAAMDDELRPIAALRYARYLTLGRYWPMVTRYIGLIVLILVLAIPISLITELINVLKLTPLAILFFQLATTFTVLPVANIYLLNLYHDLENLAAAETDSDESEVGAKQPKPKAAAIEAAA